jgi:putative peptidoglycan lipid II flippase
VKSFLRKLAPAVFGLAVFQLNALITQTYFASRYGEGGISILTYAHRLIQFPLGVIGIALATASFPQIAQHFARNENGKAAKLFTTVAKYMMLIMLPSAAGLIVLDQDIVGLIYNWRHQYSPEWMSVLGMSLTGYSVGLLGYAFVKILAQSFQAQHDFRTPVITGAAGVAVNLTLCAYFSSHTDLYPLWTMTFASSAATFVNVLLLLIMLRMKLHELKITPLFIYFIKVITASLVMYLCCWLVMSVIPDSGQSFLFKATRVGIGMSAGFLSYGIVGRFLFWTELKAILRIR